MSEIYNRIEGERNIFVTSDHHFFHRNLIALVGRPFQSEYGMNRHMVEQWNKVIHPEDLVVHVGDFSAGLKGRKKELIKLTKELNGERMLILGNHDHFTEEYYLDVLGFSYVDFFYIYKDIMFSHYPLVQNPKYPNEQIDLLVEIAKENKSKLILHGHQHNPAYKNYENHFNVCVDRHEYKPINLKLLYESRIR